MHLFPSGMYICMKGVTVGPIRGKCQIHQGCTYVRKVEQSDPPWMYIIMYERWYKLTMDVHTYV